MIEDEKLDDATRAWIQNILFKFKKKELKNVI
jgi:hypothetical protein